ncbi:hypothetical protein K437DRAFT_247486 [Tilletiaria anomala UBC 951]|uniref:Uncharacterized protein n=1 Tax=Tilletiaria anomala (strain ATCC 24038 / CBS 436.72 / UBC 951) TaxID=1037660 RepID=A0A066VT53_TILAU|nr:uncharacterized protein K437DRAFT_247486 [Tilletiaria anomala UBC 951]KDN44877.1 hypothetical protein K437DRAFT_247486 [Tilletiaria anomala UBC 951]
MSEVKRRGNAAGAEADDLKGKGKAHEEDPFAVLAENASAEPLNNEEQQKIIEELREQNKKWNYIYRSAVLLMQGLLFIFYFTPLPSYIAGTHPQNHLIVFWGSGQGTHDDLIYLPALPFYIAFLLIQGGLLYMVAFETADAMEIPAIIKRRKSYAFPAQPHPFGTAPNFLVPPLSQIRWAPSGGRADQDHTVTEGQRIAATTSPRLMYLVVLCVASLPLPLMTFGAGSFGNAGWWALTPLVIGVTCCIERSIWSSERQTHGLAGLRYNYKGA